MMLKYHDYLAISLCPATAGGDTIRIGYHKKQCF